MADQDGLLYKPDIAAPEREKATPQVSEYELERRATAEVLGVTVDDIPTNPYDTMIARFRELELNALELKDRSIFLLDRTIEDIDGYVGDAPLQILKYIQDLTGRQFTTTDANGEVSLLPKTDDVYTLSSCEMKCIFRAAGYYDPATDEYKVSTAIVDGEDVVATLNQLQESKFLDLKDYSITLLILVLKMSFVITVHYTIGYLCGWFKESAVLKTALNIISGFFGKILGGSGGLGTFIQDALAGMEKTLLGIVGYRCNEPGEPLPDCESDSWQDMEIKRVNCCTTKPLFFDTSNVDSMSFDVSSCFEKWAAEAVDPTGLGTRTLCSTTNCADTTESATGTEQGKAATVATYLQEQPSSTGVMNPSDIQPLSKAIYNAEAGTIMARQSQSALNRSKNYIYTGEKNAPWDCFGYAMVPTDARKEMLENMNKLAGSWSSKPSGPAFVHDGSSLFGFLELVDNAISTALRAADKVVISVANLSKWGASKQLCCYVYMLVMVGGLIESVIDAVYHKKPLCDGTDINSAFRNQIHAQWASELRNTEALKMMVQILDILKRLIDIFRKRMNRSIFLAGLKFPLREMWEMIKAVLANSIAEYLDVILGPIDQVLAGIKGLPEVRHMIANECFGIDKLFDFLQCFLGNFKWGIVNWIMQFMDFSLNDFTLIEDLYLSRVKTSFLDALSQLLGSMINLLVGLRDCYDPSVLSDEIVKKQMTDQYDYLGKYYLVMNNTAYVARMDQCASSIMNQSFIPSQERQDELETGDGTISQTFRQMGLTGFTEKVMRDSLTGVNGTIDMMQFSTALGDDPDEGTLARPISYAEFVKVMEQQTGVGVTEVVESMQYIFDILRGKETS